MSGDARRVTICTHWDCTQASQRAPSRSPVTFYFLGVEKGLWNCRTKGGLLL